MDKIDFELEFIRGDSCNFKFPIKNLSGTTIPIEDIETIFVTCKKTPNKKSDILFQKTISDITYSDEYYHVQILPEDTENIDCYGTYPIDIEITLPDGFRRTKFGSLTLQKETTNHD